METNVTGETTKLAHLLNGRNMVMEGEGHTIPHELEENPTPRARELTPTRRVIEVRKNKRKKEEHATIMLPGRG